MAENSGRNDPCPCGSGKKFKKCCGVQKKLNTRSATVISGSKASSLLDRIHASSGLNKDSEEQTISLKDRVSKMIEESPPKKSD